MVCGIGSEGTLSDWEEMGSPRQFGGAGRKREQCLAAGAAVWEKLSRVRVRGILAALTVIFTPPGPMPFPPKGLQHLVVLSHAHSRECSLVPGLRGPGGRDGGLVWECSAGHTFSWGPSSGPTPPQEAKLAPLPSTSEKSWCQQARGEQEPAGR